jgi:DNA-binding transcriptional regulator LsrR (DeoR family)
MILGIAWGTTTTAISRYLVPKTTHHSQIIQLNGAGNLESMGIEYASEIILRFAENFHASYHLFPVPAFFDNPRTRKALWEETSIQKLLGLQAKADLLLFSIGAVNAGVPSHIHTEGYLQDKDYADLKRWGVAGDIASRFFREDGSDESVLINQRSSGPPLSQIRQKHGICVIAGEEKLKGLRAALKGRLLKELIIDEPSARAFVERFSNGQ